jgi:hypothetical protein
MKYDRQNQQEKATINERIPHDPALRTSGKEPMKTGQGVRQSMDKAIN